MIPNFAEYIFLRLAIFIGYGALLAYLSLMPGDDISVDVSDKLLHFVAYAAYAVLALIVTRSSARYLWLCLLIVGYGGLIEVLQSFMPTREMSLLDLVANTSGVVVVYFTLRLAAVLVEGGKEPSCSTQSD